MWTDLEDLLPGDKYLLDEDFDALGRASAIDQLLWVAEMEASMTAANYGLTGSKYNEQTDDTTRDINPTQAAKIASGSEEQDSKGSGA